MDALPDELLYPDETAVWEERLSLMSDGEDTLDSFLADQIKFLQHLIDKLGFDKQVSSGQMMPNVVRTISNQNRKRPLDNSSTDISKLPICPLCKKGHLQRKNGKFGGAFLGCTNYPECRYTQPVGGNQAEQDMNIDVPEESRVYKCPRCQKGYFVKQENGGRINWVCSNRSECRTQCSDVHGVPSVYANK
nr:topoisomerase DNA-binding C4 zinc finger domain-containing protein [Veillonella denticariosi]